MMVDAGCAWMIDNQALTDSATAGLINEWLKDRARLHEMGQAAKQLHKDDALARVVAVCQEYLHA